MLSQLEDAKKKACVLNGPVFDGPVAPKGGLPDASKPGKADPKFGGVQIPKFFWKLMVVVVVGIGGALKKLFDKVRGKKEETPGLSTPG